MSLKLSGIEHSFGSNRVLKGVDFTIHSGEVHALLGMNGAGKSTVLQIIAGIHVPDQGEITVDDKPVSFTSPVDAMRAGITYLTQEVDRGLFPALTIHENFMVSLWNQEGQKFYNKKENRRRVASVFAQYGIDLDVDKLIRDCSLYEKQIVSLIRAISYNSKYILLDEPTAALDHREVAKLHQIIEKLKQEGIGFVLISHRLKEVFQIAERITVLRDGKVTLAKQVAETTIEEVVHAMTGDAELATQRKARDFRRQEVAFAVEQVKVAEHAAPLSCQVRAGEIVVVFGLLGSGKTHFAETLFGVHGQYEPVIHGVKRKIKSPQQAVKSGIAFIPEERGKQGIWKQYDIRSHLSLSFKGLIAKQKELAYSHQLIDLFAIQPQAPGYEVGSLSGGNQQKVAIAKWFGNKPRLLIFDEPMKGIDVAAKETIFQRIESFAEEGASVLYFTAEPDEALRIADRILVFSQGEIIAEVDPAQVGLEQLLDLAERGRKNAAS